MITEAAIRAAMKRVESETILRDPAEARGAGSLSLVVRRLADGRTSAQWFANTKRNGRRAKVSLGQYPALSLADARQRMRTEVSPMLAAGKPLRAPAEANAERPTVDAMFRGYVASMRAKGRASADEVERMLLEGGDSAAAVLGRDRLAGSVDEGDVVAYVARFFKRGKRGAADKARAYVSAAYGWAIKATHDYTVEHRRDWGVTRNPAANVAKDAGAKQTRERALSAPELRALWHGTAGVGFGFEVGACVRLLVCCGQRVEETLRVDGAEIDLDAALWSMPADKTKGGKRAHVVPLHPLAVEEFRRLKEAHGDGPLFPSRTGADDERIGHRSVRRAIARWVDGRADVAPFQTRDLRRTWKSRAHDAGVDRYTRDLIQQHAKGDTGSVHYDRADYLPQMREAMAKWGAWLSGVVADERSAEALAA